jgi:NitT/TauT family transport system permease protein
MSSPATLLPPVREEYERPLEPLGELVLEAPLPLGCPHLRAELVAQDADCAGVDRYLGNRRARDRQRSAAADVRRDVQCVRTRRVVSGELLQKTAVSMSVLLRGYLLGAALAFVLTSLAVSTRLGRDVLSMLTAMFNPLPSIALLPLALLWFGLGTRKPVVRAGPFGALAAGAEHLFRFSVGAGDAAHGRPQLRAHGMRHVLLILVPAALPAILAGLKVGWAFAWRTLIAAELVFGASSGSGGLGWYIFQNRNELYTDRVFAGLAAVIVIGLLIEHLVFDTLERVTVRRWGSMQRFTL